MAGPRELMTGINQSGSGQHTAISAGERKALHGGLAHQLPGPTGSEKATGQTRRTGHCVKDTVSNAKCLMRAHTTARNLFERMFPRVGGDLSSM
jgi:hypothetical protein